MNDLIRFRDIFDPERIEKYMADHQNVVIPATDCETLDGFTADFGYTYYPYPYTSVYRTPTVAQNGVLSRLQHRFWQFTLPDELKCHMGKRYIALVIYAVPGEELYFNVQWCDKVLGCVNLTRLDGCRHLVVLEDAIVSKGNMEVLQFITDCKNICRIDHIALLNYLPESDTYTPDVLDFIASQLINGVRFDFLTKFAAKSEIEISNYSGIVWSEKSEVVHTVHSFEYKAPVGSYTVKITAVTELEEITSRDFMFEIKERVVKHDLTVPVEIVSSSNTVKGTPLTFGIPLGCKEIYDIAEALFEGNDVQLREMSYWEDGSIKWLLCDSVLPYDIEGGEVRKANMHLRAGKSNDKTSNEMSLYDNEKLILVKLNRYSVYVGEGFLPFAIYDENGEALVLKSETPFSATLGNGETLHCGTLSGLCMEENGIYRTVIRYEMPLLDCDGNEHFNNTVRIICDRRDSTVTLRHRLMVTSTMLEPAMLGGKVKIDMSKFPTAATAIDGTQNEEPTIIRLSDMTVNFGKTQLKDLHYDGTAYENRIRVVAMSDLGYKTIENGKVTEIDGHAPSEIRANSIALGIKDFWKLYPKAVDYSEEVLSFEIFPKIDFSFPETDEDAWHRLYFCYKDKQYRLKTGIAPTTDIVFCLSADKLPEYCCAVRPEINYLNACRVYPFIAPRNVQRYPGYEACLNYGLERLKKDREQMRSYGFHNFGDWYGETAFSWGNNEYDGPFSYLVEFLRGGNYEWYELGRQAARHLADIDLVNFSTRQSDIGAQHIHIPGHCGGYLPPYFRNKGKGSRCKPSHAWLEGPYMYYALTGDMTVYESISKSAKWFLNCGIQNYDFHNGREAGWHLIHLCGAYSMSGERKFLNAANVIIEKALVKQGRGKDGAWIRQLTSAHCGCHKPHCFGEAGFMVGLLLVGMSRYYNITCDERVKQSIIKGTRWLVNNTFNYEVNNFAYTNCPVVFNKMCSDRMSRMVAEPLIKAWELSGEEEFANVVRRINHCIGNIDESEVESGTTLGYGKFLCSDIRNTPLLIEQFMKVIRGERT